MDWYAAKTCHCGAPDHLHLTECSAHGLSHNSHRAFRSTSPCPLDNTQVTNARLPRRIGSSAVAFQLIQAWYERREPITTPEDAWGLNLGKAQHGTERHDLSFRRLAQPQSAAEQRVHSKPDYHHLSISQSKLMVRLTGRQMRQPR